MKIKQDFATIFDTGNEFEILEKVKRHLGSSNINAIDRNRFTLLHYAITDKLSDVAKYLVERGADVNGTRACEFYPLELAADHENLQAIKIMNASGKLKYNRKSDKSLPLAAARGYYEIAQYLLDKGADVNTWYRQRTAIHWATQEGYYDIVKLLIDYHADVNRKHIGDEMMAETALYIAAAEGHYRIAELLLENGALVNTPTFHSTPFMIACSWENLDIAKILLDAGANIDFKDNDGRTSLFLAKVRDKQNIIDFLIQNGASTKVSDDNGITISDLDDSSIKEGIYQELFGEDDGCALM